MPAHQTKPRRLAILNRHFWPISNASEMEVAWLQNAIAATGLSVEVITVRWQKHWPEKFVFRQNLVHRLPKPLSGPFGKHRFNKALLVHLIDHQYDGLITFGLGDEVCQTAHALKHELPIVMRITAAALAEVKSLGNRELQTLMSASAILADSASTRDTLLAGIPEIEDRLSVAAPCIDIDDELSSGLHDGQVDPFRSPVRQLSARAALSDAHPILQIQSRQPLVVTGMSMDSELGVCDLVKAWKTVQHRLGTARLWIIGEGRLSRRVWDSILKHDLIYTAIMPGFFDHFDAIFQSADLYVHPARTDSPCCLLDAARAHGVCSISTASDAEMRDILDQHVDQERHTDRPFVHAPQRGLLVPRAASNVMSAAILAALADDDFRLRVGNQTRHHCAQQFARSNPVFSYLQPFEHSAKNVRDPTTNTSSHVESSL